MTFGFGKSNNTVDDGTLTPEVQLFASQRDGSLNQSQPVMPPFFREQEVWAHWSEVQLTCKALCVHEGR